MSCEHQVGWVARVASGPLGLAFAVASIVLLSACGAQHADHDQGSRSTVAAADRWPHPGGGEVRMSRMVADFALLRSPAKPLPTQVVRVMSPRFPGMLWNRAHPVPTALPDDYWLVPGPEHLCLMDVAPKVASIGTVCETNAQALHHGIANTLLDRASHVRTIVGAVPDGIRTLIIESGGQQTLVRASHGEFVHRDSIPLPPDRLELCHGASPLAPERICGWRKRRSSSHAPNGSSPGSGG
jgi:hypothetical protein